MGKVTAKDLIDIRFPCKGIMIPKSLIKFYGITKEEAVDMLEKFYGDDVAIRIYG